LVGVVSLSKYNEFDKTATLGYWLGEAFWRRGVMGEAAEEILKFGFEELKLRRINVEAVVENIPSNNLIKKLGFTFEGTRIKYAKAKATGIANDVHMYGLLRERWLERNKN